MNEELTPGQIRACEAAYEAWYDTGGGASAGMDDAFRAGFRAALALAGRAVAAVRGRAADMVKVAPGSTLADVMVRGAAAATKGIDALIKRGDV